MSENRKPDFILLLRNQGKQKSNKVELFDADLWEYKRSCMQRGKKYRMRVNGKWHGEGVVFLSKWEIRDLIWRSIRI